MQNNLHTAHQAGLFRHSILLLIATQVGNVATLLFQVVMMRQLSVTEYGILASMLSLVLIMGTPLEALRTAVAHQTALLVRMGQAGAIKTFWAHWARTLLVASLIITVVALGLSRSLAAFFQLPSAAPVMLTGLIIAGSLFMPYFAGALQGTQSFVWMAVHGQVWGVTRLVMGLLFIAVLGQTAMTGLWAQGAGVVGSIVVGVLALTHILRRHTEEVEVPFAGWSYFVLSLTVLAGYAVMMNADVALVKRFFDPEDAGTFARAATIGRSIVFLPVPIAAAMFPKVVSAGQSTLADRTLLLKAIAFTGVLIGGAGLVCTVGTPLLWLAFTGENAGPDTIQLVRRVIWALAPLGLTFLLMNFEIAQRRFRAPAVLVLLAIAYIVSVSIWHETVEQVVFIMSVVNGTSLVVMLVDMWRWQPKQA